MPDDLMEALYGAVQSAKALAKAVAPEADEQPAGGHRGSPQPHHVAGSTRTIRQTGTVYSVADYERGKRGR